MGQHRLEEAELVGLKLAVTEAGVVDRLLRSLESLAEGEEAMVRCPLKAEGVVRLLGTVEEAGPSRKICGCRRKVEAHQIYLMVPPGQEAVTDAEAEEVLE